MFQRTINLVSKSFTKSRHLSQRLNSSTSRLYTKKHEWISIAEDKLTGRVGISNHAQEALGDVVYVQLPEVGVNLSQFEEAGAIESVKAASELLSPMAGQVISINEQLESKPSLINSDCYGEGWLFDLKVSESNQVKDLMNEDEYERYLKEDSDDK